MHGRWQEDRSRRSAPRRRTGGSISEFDQRISEFRSSGEFTIPMELGAKPSALDRISMQQWLRERTSSILRICNWYVNYACRDDYGALARDISAWAGIHYFASREPEDKGPLTWPEGNGWIAQRLLAKLRRYVRTNSAVYRIARAGDAMARAHAGDTNTSPTR